MTEPINLRPGTRQLFIDDHIIESSEGLRRTLHAFEKHPENPVILPDKPWEDHGIVIYGSVLREGGDLWRMWYLTRFSHPDGQAFPHGCFAMAYAESADGLHWRKPPVGSVERGDLHTNIVMDRRHHPDFREPTGVIRDDTDPDPSRCYKAIFHTVPVKQAGVPQAVARRYCTLTSPDGIHWSDLREIPTEHPIVPDIAHFTYDPIEKQYVLWARAQYASDEVRGRAPDEWFGRAVSLITSDDFVNWHDHGVVLAPDMDDPPAGDIYSMTGLRNGDLWIGLVQFYDQCPDRHTLDIQLASSRNGTQWTRFADRTPILPLGGLGEWDRFNHSIACNLVEVDNELRLYYAGRTYRHTGYQGDDDGPRRTGIGVARLRRDGFVSLDAPSRGGTLLTKPLTLPTADLFLNLKSDYGSAKAEVLSSDGTTLAESLPILADSVRHKVHWSDNSNHDALTTAPVRLRLHLSNANLYALWAG